MPFLRPTISQIVARVKSDLESRLTSGSATLRRSVIAVLAIVIAGAVHLLYGAIEFFSRQIFGDQAEDEYMVRLASQFGVTQKPAGFAEGAVVFVGADGGVVPVDFVMQRSDGVLFSSTETGVIASGSVSINMKAQVAGISGNTDAAVSLNAVSPLSGVSSTATVGDGGIANGIDEESLEDFRARYLERVRRAPQGGTIPDYERWAKEVPGVTRAWGYSKYLGPSTVGLTFVQDNETDIIPDSTKVAEVQAYIDTLRPTTDDPTVFAPTSVPLNFSIQLIDVDTPAVRAAITAELADLIKREAEPAGTLKLSHIQEAISLAAGEVDHDLTSPSADVTTTAGQLTTMGTITWA